MQYDSNLLKELNEIIDVKISNAEKKKSPVIFDGNQFTVKIPKKIAEKAGITAKDEFEFEVKTSIIENKRTKVLKGILKSKQ